LYEILKFQKGLELQYSLYYNPVFDTFFDDKSRKG